MEFYFQSNSVMNSLKCPKSKSLSHCLTKLFPFYQNKHWTIQRRNDGSVDPPLHRILSKIEWIFVFPAYGKFPCIKKIYEKCVYNFWFQILEKVDCKWSSWSQCPKSCGTGTQFRTIQIQAKNGGQVCTGSSKRICNTQSCPGNYN